MTSTYTNRWTAADVLAMPKQSGRTIEVIDGELFVTPAPMPPHQSVTVALWRVLDDFTRDTNVAFAYGAPADITLDLHTLVQPDVLVAPAVHGRRPVSWDEISRLLLAVEVLSPSSQRCDRVVKRHLYARMGCEYWIVDPAARLVERWLPDDTRPEIREDALTWQLDGVPHTLTINLVALFGEALD
ncbi:MAG: Uma2 family endonuclease [Gemmatimonas sp.]